MMSGWAILTTVGMGVMVYLWIVVLGLIVP